MGSQSPLLRLDDPRTHRPGGSGYGSATAGDGPLPPELQGVRAAVARHHSVEQATGDGYVRASLCKSTLAGAMGHHHAGFALMGRAGLSRSST